MENNFTDENNASSKKDHIVIFRFLDPSLSVFNPN
jgi:hypothetical protein